MMAESVRSMTHQPAKLPSRLTPFVGRKADLDTLLRLLEDPSVRLVTISGTGGVGKTALALELVSRLQGQFENGAAFVPLAQLNSVDELLPALAESLDVQSAPSGDLQQAVLDHLSNLHMLLVLDSFEHLLDEAVLVRDILVAAPRVQILITSREKLHLEAETLYNLGGLPLPAAEDMQSAPPTDSVRLFVQKAHQVRPGFSLNEATLPPVVRICRMVDGNPLGILLAASWAEHFSPDEIAREAEHSLDFLKRDLRDIEPRHSGLRSVFDSSFQRLDKNQKVIFRKLSVFRGGFDLAAAKAVANADLVGLISLVEKSMLMRVPETGRYELHGLLHQYAREELASAGDAESVRAAHTSYYAAFVQARELRIISSSQAAALDEMQADLDNIRQAWGQVVEKRDFNCARSMMPGLYAFCDMRSRFYEGEAMFRQASERLAPRDGECPDGAWALALLSWYDIRTYIERLESYKEMTSNAHRCLDHARASDDPEAAAASLALLGHMAQHQGDFKTAIRHYEAAMRACPALDDVYWLNMRIGLGYQADGQYDKAIKAYELGIRRGRETGEGVKLGSALLNIGDTLILQGKPAEAEPYLEQALEQFQHVGTRFGVMWSLYSLSRVASARGEAERARELAQEARQLAGQVHSAGWTQRLDALLQELDPEHVPASHAAERLGPDSLSERELEVLHLLESDMTGPEIASTLVVSLNTVRFHTKHIYQKLGVNNRMEAIHRAKELGL